MKRKVEEISYILTQKKVKNINLRLNTTGEIFVSANKFIPVAAIDEFVLSKKEWLKKAQQRLLNKQDFKTDKTNEQCLDLFNQISDKIYEIFKTQIKGKPLIKVRLMKSCWGVCHFKKGYITLNKMLIEKPIEAIEYVVLHEYVHFLEPNHKSGFHNIMQNLMPDYKERKKLLYKQ